MIDITKFRKPSLLHKQIDWFMIDINGVGFHTYTGQVLYPRASSPRALYSSFVYRFVFNDEESNPFQLNVEWLIADAWCMEDPNLWKDSYWADEISRWREFRLGILNDTIRKTEYYDPKTDNTYYVGRDGSFWSSKYCYKHVGGYTRDGYFKVKVTINNKKTAIGIHRIVAKAFCPIPKRHLDVGKTYADLEVNHIDGNPSNNNAENLEWCTCEENVNHAFRLHPIRGGKRVLSPAEIKIICPLLVQGVPDAEIAKLVGRGSDVIFGIRHRTRPKYEKLWRIYRWKQFDEIRDEATEKWFKLFLGGFCLDEIAFITGVNYSTVQHKLQWKSVGPRLKSKYSNLIEKELERRTHFRRRTKAQKLLMRNVLLPKYKEQYEAGELPVLDDERMNPFPKESN